VRRRRRPFAVHWDEAEEVGMVARRGERLVGATLGEFWTGRCLLGRSAFGQLVEAVRARHRVEAWTPWLAIRRHLGLR